MTQTFNDIPSTATLQNSRQPLLDRDNAAASNFSGTTFPSTNLLVGMRCHRTDLGKIYALKDLTPTWIEVEDINGTSGLSPQATKLATTRAFSITGDGTATAINFDGTGAVALALTLAASGATAGTYTKVTVDAKGRVTAGAAIANTDLPTAISQATLRATTGTMLSSISGTAHGFQIGPDSSVNMAFSGREIQSRNNGVGFNLMLNMLGGDVYIGDGATSQIKLDGQLNAASLIRATQAEAEAGTVTNKLMTPLQTAQAIAALGPALITTSSVLAATAGATAGAVGAYGFFAYNGAGTPAPGATTAGSNLNYSSVSSGGTIQSTSPSGTWRQMGYGDRNSTWLRIS